MPSNVQPVQNRENHTRYQPAFHFFAVPVMLVCLVSAVYHAFGVRTLASLWLILFVLAVIVTLFLTRLNALKVQDRVIRLEERLRLTTLLPDSLRPRIAELSESQLVALRFASDGELPSLIEKTLGGNWTSKQIKQAIQVWRPDTFRV